MQNTISFVTIGSVLNMMSFTHVLYAKQICEHISLKYGITLKRYSFIYGSVTCPSPLVPLPQPLMSALVATSSPVVLTFIL